MSIRLGINGFGRMGRLTFREIWGHPELEIAHINEPKGGIETAAHLLEFDTVHGRWAQNIETENSVLRVAGKEVTFSEHTTIENAPWAEKKIELVLECSGHFRTSVALQPYFDQGVKKVIVASPVKDGPLNIVMGCNDHLYDPEINHLVTAASCTTNCLAPVVKVIHESFGIVRGVITTIHNVTNTQVVVDAPHRDLRRSRSALNSMIPTTTGSATAITMIYPELKGKLNGIAVRVPLLNASITDCVFEVGRDVTVEEINNALKTASKGPLIGILGFEEKPLVSADYVNDKRSSIVDGPATMVVDHRMVKILAWYDNEIGYANRMVELALRVAKTLPRG